MPSVAVLKMGDLAVCGGFARRDGDFENAGAIAPPADAI